MATVLPPERWSMAQRSAALEVPTPPVPLSPPSTPILYLTPSAMEWSRDPPATTCATYASCWPTNGRPWLCICVYICGPTCSNLQIFIYLTDVPTPVKSCKEVSERRREHSIVHLTC